MNELALLIVALLVLALMMRLDFVYYVVYVLAGIWLFARLATPRSLRALRVVRQYVDHAFLGETVSVTLRLINTTWLPMPWLRVTESLPLELATATAIRRVYTLRPREEVTINYDLRCTRRGYYPVGPLQLATGDLFGFVDVQGRDEGQQFITVYPRIIPLAGLSLTSRLPFGVLASSQRIFEDPARLRGVREYRPGDTMRRINWKASAHADDLLVNQFSPAIALESMILLNLNVADYDRQRRFMSPEWAIVLAASLANYLARARQSVGLATNGIDPLLAAGQALAPRNGLEPDAIPPRPGQPHVMKILETLARVEISERQEPFALWARRASVPLGWGATVLAITPQADVAACQGLHALVRAGLNVVMLVVEPYGRFAAVQERARRLGFVAYLVATEDDLTKLQAHSLRAARAGQQS